MKQSKATIKVKLIVLLSLLLAVATGNAVFTFLLENYGEEKLGWVNHTHEVIIQTESYLSAMQDTETGQRGYLLTDDLSYLEPYYRGTERAESMIKELEIMVADNPTQVERIEAIKKPMQKKLDELSKTITLAQTGKKVEALDLVKQNTGKRHMDNIRLLIQEFINAEKVLLEKRSGEYREHKTRITTLIIVEILIFIFLSIFSISFLDRLLFTPLHTLLSNTRKMEEGKKLDAKDLTSKDEMGYLLYSFFKMNEKVHERTEVLDRKAHHDELTGLLNRTNVLDEIDTAIIHAKKSATKAAILFLDLNKFKTINDTLGHDVGDIILQKSAKRLIDSTRSDDLVFRVGGDEFVILLTAISKMEDVEYIVSKVLKTFESPMMIQGKPLDVSTSIGISIAPDNSEDAEEVMKMADVAMYNSKQDQETHFAFFDPQMLKRSND